MNRHQVVFSMRAPASGQYQKLNTMPDRSGASTNAGTPMLE